MVSPMQVAIRGLIVASMGAALAAFYLFIGCSAATRPRQHSGTAPVCWLAAILRSRAPSAMSAGVNNFVAHAQQ
jgi:hypothetical protein